jgi:hypothetical protein
MRLEDGELDGVRVMTAVEFAQMRAAIQDPDYIKRLAADTKAMGMVEVDNPMRREVRPRRGTERRTTAEPTCTCHPVPEQYHTTHYGATEPGSTLEPDYGCAEHFPKVKREWGKAPGLIRMSRFGDGWIVACRLCPKSSTGAPRNLAWPKGDLLEAVEVLAAHHEAEHVDAMFRGDRGGPLGMAMDRTSERGGA